MPQVIALSAILVAFNSTVHLLPGFNALYVPLNIMAAALLGIAARREQLTWEELGLDGEYRAAGLRLGALVALVAAAVLLVGVAFPLFHGLFDDERLADIGPALVAYRAFIRIPLGTALFEEFAFRGVLLAAWRRVAGVPTAVVGSSLVFGLWHIRPALELLDANGVAMGRSSQGLAVAAAVGATTLAGVFFSVLRLRSNSLWAPYVAHAAINSLALVAAAVVTGRL
ncbi:MAG: type II CAAX endopeptidase family protein [Acidimicrobiia bacterium]|nr:type II CAAX endopeptidase family protein [Acidimicrobiia bacterium]